MNGLGLGVIIVLTIISAVSLFLEKEDDLPEL